LGNGEQKIQTPRLMLLRFFESLVRTRSASIAFVGARIAGRSDAQRVLAAAESHVLILAIVVTSIAS
jgi:hypothetical protein